ncbi:hypothetical protein ASPZODRAFT_133157 [Penicilliopsis zonata CBS 506.65]|uniref:Methyltransferase domain-containing protein n=1 Tax=Penicilliopsis zonata CBS 506.65 TaxID=1073090 RepID=A0A1L9SGE4_9EURO|nr:hypothetical protein ASPZODRAFT_133157 [Penicilliopsis zonata CBS 506.65]OJJ46157.1 hypothetical protein ASPZODRAFT_133157 [Penicilliopsis zonata CBS 506.65]
MLTKAYSTSASFVPQLASTVLSYLNPQPTDRVLDVGCGDGKFTARFLPAVGEVVGVDSSPSMIQSATKEYAGPRAEFKVVDCRFLDEQGFTGFDKVISNAALHWILRDESTRMSTLRACYSALNPGGSFVFEMGGHGNIDEMVAALLAVLVGQQGISIEKAREACPWFFPSEKWMQQALEEIGFEVVKLETEFRPTRLTDDAAGGLAGWVRLMGAQFLDLLPDAKREEAVQQVCAVLQTVVTRIEDGSQYLNYVRLRGVARRV